MYKKLVSALHTLNILFQALYSLALPIGIGALASFLLVKYASAPRWIWALLLVAGALMGLYSMIKYLLSAIKNLERLEKQQAENQAAKEEKERLQAELRDEFNKKESKGG